MPAAAVLTVGAVSDPDDSACVPALLESIFPDSDVSPSFVGVNVTANSGFGSSTAPSACLFRNIET